MDENGYSCGSLLAQQQRRRRHFRNVFNVVNIVDMEEMDRVTGRPMVSKLAQEPSLHNVDLQKVYDSVLCAALWAVLSKLGTSRKPRLRRGVQDEELAPILLVVKGGTTL